LKGKQPKKVKAPSLFCYWAVNELGVSLTEPAWRLGRPNEPTQSVAQRYVETADDGNRIRIYIAENSHATYFRVGEINTPNVPGAGVGTQAQYDPISISYDVITAPVIRNYLLLSSERKDEVGIYDWRGKWGQEPY